MRNFLASMLILASFLVAQEIKFESLESKVNIIELYTSQGCSSCPPADKWLSKLKTQNGLFKEFIPMAFHVTYWNYIGWKDTFSKSSYDMRQKYYATQIWQNNSVYTPQFVIDAKEYQEWFSNRNFPKFDKKYGGDLKVTLNDKKLEISYFNKNIKSKNAHINIALLGFDYNIEIKRGENRSKTLKHDFVVLEHIKKSAIMKNNKIEKTIDWAPLTKQDTKQAIAVWISLDDSTILQATGGYF